MCIRDRYGPVHRNPSKGYMAGAKHSSAPHPVVTAKRVFNSTIMDHRVLRQLDELASFDTGTTKCKVPKFGDIYFSRDNSDRTRYIFGINFYEIARSASEHSWLFKNPAVGRSLTKGTKIVSLKLLRSLAQESKGVTKLNIPKSNYAVNGIILNNTPQVVDSNQFRGDIFVKPSRAINFIQLNFVAVRSGVSFSEVTGAI